MGINAESKTCWNERQYKKLMQAAANIMNEKTYNSTPEWYSNKGN